MIIRVVEDLTQRRKVARAQRRQPFFASLGLCVFAFLPVLAQDQADQIARARELLRQSREAIGDAQAWEQLQTLSASGRVRRPVKYVSVQSPEKVEEKEKTLNGKVKFDFALPDRYRCRITNATLSGYSYSSVEVINGDRAWRTPPPPVISSFGDNRVIDVGDVERSREKYAHDARQQIALYTLGWLLRTPESFPVEFIYAGAVEAEGRKLEAIVVKGPGGFAPMLLLDRETKLPFAIVLSFVEVKRVPVFVEVASVSRQFIHETYSRARREREARRRLPQRRELQYRFSDHQSVAGLQLPHRLTTIIDGEVLDELTINEFRINQPINQKKFEGEPEVR